jgi:hypothetical protein
MFGRLRAFLSLATDRAAPTPRPARFCPSLECLGDRALPAAGPVTAAASAPDPGAEAAAVTAWWHQLGNSEHVLLGTALVRAVESWPLSSTTERVATVQKVETRVRSVAVSNPLVGAALASVAEDWRSGQGITGTEVGRVIEAGIREVIVSDPQLVGALSHLAKFWHLGPGVDGTDTSLGMNGVASEHLNHHSVKLLPESEPATGAEPDRPVPPTGPVIPSADSFQTAWRITLESLDERQALASPGADEPIGGPPVSTGAAPDRVTTAPARPEQPAPVPPSVAPSEPAVEPEAAPFITRFLPFDTAGLREDVSAFLSELESMIQVAPEQLFPDAWESAAVLAAGTGAVLALGKWRTARTRPGRVEPAGSPVPAAGAPGGA